MQKKEFNCVKRNILRVMLIFSVFLSVHCAVQAAAPDDVLEGRIIKSSRYTVIVVPSPYTEEYVLIKITQPGYIGDMDQVRGKFHYPGINQVIYDETADTRFTGEIEYITTSVKEAADWWRLYND